MLKQLRDNIITQIELEKEECNTIYAMYKANSEDTITEIYEFAKTSNDKSIQNAIYELEQRYSD